MKGREGGGWTYQYTKNAVKGREVTRARLNQVLKMYARPNSKSIINIFMWFCNISGIAASVFMPYVHIIHYSLREKEME